jgi:CubicO group peptidase (beta-lactamase class C family)
MTVRMPLIEAVLILAFTMAVGHADDLPRSTPEAQGVSSEAILKFIDDADKSVDSMHSVMILRHGQVVAEGWWAPYRPEAPHSLYSLSKSFTSTAMGLAIAEGKLSLDDPVLKFFPDDAPENPGNNLKSMRVSDLLRMSTGQQSEPPRTNDEPWVKTFLAQPVPFKPGTHFLYNTSATYMLSAIVQKATGETVLDYLTPRLFEPLGIKKPTWEASPQGISAGGYGLSLRTEDIARFGQLLLQHGKWDGKQIMPAEWIAKATARQTSNGSSPDSDWDQGYGYQFWRCRRGAFRGDGAFGQFCIVLPEQDVVIAITSGTRDMQHVLNLVWEHLLPGMNDKPRAENPNVNQELKTRLSKLTLPTVSNEATPAIAQSRIFRFDANDRRIESLQIESSKGGETTTLVVKADGTTQRIACPAGQWKDGRHALHPMPEQPAATTGGWTSPTTFTAKVCLYETPFVLTMRFAFDGDEVRLETEANIGFGPTKQPPLVGKAE